MSIGSTPPRRSLRRGRAAWLPLVTLLLLPGAAFAPARAQDTLPDLGEEWRWVDFGPASGLPPGDVYGLEEADGRTWVRTDEGIAWYDGFVWNRVSARDGLPSGHPSSMEATADGRLLVVVEGEVYRGGVSGFEFVELGLEAGRRVRKVAPLEDNRFYLTLDGVFPERDRLGLYTGAGVELVPDLPAVLTQAEGLWRTESGRIWVETRVGLVVREDGGWRRMEDVPNRSRTVTRLFEGPSGTGVAFRSSPDTELGLLTWGPGQLPGVVESEGENPLRSAAVGGGLVIAVYQTGALRVREEGTWRSFELPPARDDGVHFVHMDGAGRLWFGSGRGLHLFRPDHPRWRQTRYPFPDPRNRVNALLVSDSALWVGTTGGLLVMEDGETERRWESILGHPMVVTGLARDSSGGIWVSSGQDLEGAFRWDGTTWRPFGPEQGLNAGRIHRIFVDGEGGVWFLSLGRQTREVAGVYRLAGGAVEDVVEERGLPPGAGFAFDQAPDGTIWLGLESGLVRIRGRSVRRWGREEGLGRGSNPIVFDVAVDADGRAWFAHRPDLGLGVGYVDAADRIRYVAPPGGTKGLQAWSVAVDSENVLWVGSDAGLARYAGGVWSLLDAATGLEAESVWPVAESGDDLLVGTRGAGLFRLDRSEENDPAPRVEISSAVVEGRVGQVRWRAFAPGGSLPSSRIETRWRVDGGPWSPWSTEGELVEGGFRSGEHLVEIQAKGLFGQVTEPPARASLRVPPPLVMRPEFAVPVSILVLTLLGLLKAAQSRRERHEAELRESEERWRGLVQTAPEALGIYDPGRRRFILVNEGAVDLLGYDRRELLAVDPGDLSPETQPDGRSSRAVLRAAMTRALEGAGEELEWTARTKGGGLVPCELRLDRIPGTPHPMLRVSLVDIRERLAAERRRRELEDQLRQAVKLEALGQLTAGVAHDFNNLLTAVGGSLELLQESGRLSGEDASLVAEALSAAQRGSSLTRRLLAFSRTQRLESSDVEPGPLLFGIQGLLQRAVGEAIKLELDVPEDAWVVRADRHQLERALLNLAVNARDAMPEGGRLVVEVRNVMVSEEDLPDLAPAGPAVPGAYGRIAVRDTGTGMSPEVLERALDPFFSSKPLGSGTGLGLSMVYGFASQSGGGVTLESAPGEGTEAAIYLLRATERPGSAGAEEGEAETVMPSGPPRGEGHRVLVVDDDREVRALLAKLLTRLGYRVHAVEGMEGALAHLETDDEVDVLLTDVHLRGGESGVELAREARALRPGIAVILTSGSSEEKVREVAADLEFLVLPESFDHLALAKILARILRDAGDP